MLKTRAIIFDQFGSLEKVLRVKTTQISSTPSKGSLLLRMLAAPINPSDINQIQGVYPIRPSIPGAIGGNEGVGEVIGVGPGCRHDWKVGDLVIPSSPCLGTWRTHAVAGEGQLLKMPSGVSEVAAATMSVNVFSAYRMLKDFESGTAVIQNAANSGVGRAVIQLAHNMGVKTVNVIRRRENAYALVDELKALGGTHVFFEDQLAAVETKDWIKKEFGDNLLLGLNCVGGKSTVNMARLLSHSGTLVTYGAMAREPTVIPPSLYIFNNLKMVGFWMGKWKEDERNHEKYVEMVDDICKLYAEGKLQEPAVQVTNLSIDSTEEEFLQTFMKTLETSQKPFVGRKQILTFKS